jgi:hypothetical protein
VSSLTLAAVLAVLLAAAHSILGERYILVRLFRRDNLPKLFGDVEFTKRTLRFAWHLTSVGWCGLGAILFLLGRAPLQDQAVGRVVAVSFGLSGVAALVGSRGRHPSWMVFFAIALLAWWGAAGLG